MFVSFYLGGILLAGTALLSYYLSKHFFGVSGYCEKIIFWRETNATFESQGKLDSNALDTALEAETAALLASLSDEDKTAYEQAMLAADTQQSKVSIIQSGKHPALHYCIFLIGLIGGGAITQQFFFSGQLPVALPDVGALSLVNSDTGKYVVLFLSGILVGFGTRMMGGCTSGHGLVGCSAFKPASLLATAVFFGVAIITCLIIRYGVIQ